MVADGLIRVMEIVSLLDRIITNRSDVSWLRTKGPECYVLRPLYLSVAQSSAILKVAKSPTTTHQNNTTLCVPKVP